MRSLTGERADVCRTLSIELLHRIVMVVVLLTNPIEVLTNKRCTTLFAWDCRTGVEPALLQIP